MLFRSMRISLAVNLVCVVNASSLNQINNFAAYTKTLKSAINEGPFRGMKTQINVCANARAVLTIPVMSTVASACRSRMSRTWRQSGCCRKIRPHQYARPDYGGPILRIIRSSDDARPWYDSHLARSVRMTRITGQSLPVFLLG